MKFPVTTSYLHQEFEGGDSGAPAPAEPAISQDSLPETLDEALNQFDDQPATEVEPVTETPEAPAAAQPPAWDGTQFALNVRGQQVIPQSREQLVQWAQFGQNYSQRIQEVKQQAQQEAKAEFDQERQSLSSYRQIDEYAKQNPQWWGFVEAQFAKAQEDGTLSQYGIPPELKKEIDEIKAWKQETDKKNSEAQAKAEDEAVLAQIKGIRDQYPTLPWDSLDEHGHNLETQVLHHAKENGIGTFQAAFRDLMHDSLIKLKTEHAVTEQQKAEQARRKQGIIGSKPTPVAKKQDGLKPGQTRNKSWKEVQDMALEYIGETG